jgi:hypothetical protein
MLLENVITIDFFFNEKWQKFLDVDGFYKVILFSDEFLVIWKTDSNWIILVYSQV